MKSYFSDREQSVQYGGKISGSKLQELGVVQGSKCGPLLYDIYSSDFSSVCDEDDYIMYADDTVLMYVGDSLPDLIARTNANLIKISDWCRYNKLSLNPQKCNYMIVTNKNVDLDPHITICNDEIQRVFSYKYLGVDIDSCLKSNDHVNLVAVKLARICGMSYHLAPNLNELTARKFYNSCVLSILNYCICIWGGVLQFTQRAERLVSLQKRCVKNIFGRFYGSNACIFKSAGILKIRDVHIVCVALYMYKVLKMNEHPTLQDCIDLTYPDHNYLTRQIHDLVHFLVLTPQK